ncbi:hypothetical protein MP638_006420 [Amoeboaphelidium occidentale]|nr:hypothetical protein MP638_006420 [Amoeboaphelidium occidentale]
MVYSIALFKDSLLLTSSSDIVEKDTKTGAVVRTFSAHTSTVVGIIVTNASEMITSGFDDMIIVWSLETGAVLKRIWVGSLNTQVQSISLQNNQLFTGGLDGKVRQINLITGKVVHTFNMGVQVYAVFVLENYLYVGKLYLGPPVEKYHYPSSTLLISFEGHADTVLSLYATGSLLFSGSSDKSIICWDSENGQLLRTFWLHPASVTALVVIDNVLYSGGFKGFVIKWSIDNGEVLQVFPRTNINFIRTFAWKNQELYSGSGDATVVKWNLTTGEPIFIFGGRNRVLRSAALWSNFVIDAGDNEEIHAWDTSINNVEPFRTLTEHTGSINCLLVKGDFLFSGSTDATVRQWNLTVWSIVRVLTGHTGTVSFLTSGDEHVYSAGFDLVIKKWNIRHGTLDLEFFGHTAQIPSLDLKGSILYSGSSDRTIKFWSTENAQAILSIQTTYYAQAIHVNDDFLISGTSDGILLLNPLTGEEITAFQESFICLYITSRANLVFTGHQDNVIRIRDYFTLSVIDSLQGHRDAVYSLCFDEAGNLYSASSDGSVKRWNLATRKVAFSFESRNFSVSSLIALNDYLLVGLLNGEINIFDIENAYIIISRSYHSKKITSLVVADSNIFSASIDGLLMQFGLNNWTASPVKTYSSEDPLRGFSLYGDQLYLIQGDSIITILPRISSGQEARSTSSTRPLASICAFDNMVFVGSKAGDIFSWDGDTLEPLFALKGHTSQINYLLAEDDNLYSASDDKTIIQWSIADKSIKNILKRYSASALGHLGPVNSLSLCNDVLFSGGSDQVIRRWNTVTGKHEDVYFGHSKSVTAVLCHNGSVFSGSEDSKVLMFSPKFPEKRLTQTSSIKSTKGPTRKYSAIFKKLSGSSSVANFNAVSLIAVVIIGALLLFIICTLFYYKHSRRLIAFSPSKTIGPETWSAITDLETVVNSVMGISKHAAYFIPTSSIVAVKKIAAGGGGELFTARIMDPVLEKRVRQAVVQKIVIMKNKAAQDAFFQEVGIMIMLSTFPHFCQIIGYTERPYSMILKYYSGGSLNDYLHRTAVSSKAMVKVLKEISLALQIMHSHYLAHCDLKTANVLVEVVNGLPSCFLTDFGITQVLSESIVSARMFTIASLKGISVPYAAPEAFRNFRTKKYNSVDFKKYDIFSFFGVTYEVLTRRVPWN